jgi:hypothetical protein
MRGRRVVAGEPGNSNFPIGGFKKAPFRRMAVPGTAKATTTKGEERFKWPNVSFETVPPARNRYSHLRG